MSNERLALLRQIMEVEFACLDLNLYLDTHPTEQKALMDYNTFSTQLRGLINMYECQYGMLLNFGFSLSKYPWAWLNDPWPWEIEY